MNWDHVWYNFFEILNFSGSIGYLFKFGFGLVFNHNPKYQKIRSNWYLCQVQIHFCSDFRVWFICPPLRKTYILKILYEHYKIDRKSRALDDIEIKEWNDSNTVEAWVSKSTNLWHVPSSFHISVNDNVCDPFFFWFTMIFGII